MGATPTYYTAEKKVELMYARCGDHQSITAYAKFTFEKPFCRIGEPVRTIDLSYDPTGETWPEHGEG
jgi:hypothetical protein